MAFGAVVASAQGSAADAASPLEATVTITSPVSGNLLIVAGGWSGAETSNPRTAPSTFAVLQESTTPGAATQVAGGVWWKISDGTETSAVVSQAGVAPQNVRAAYIEIEGPFAGSPLDVTAENEANLATGTTSQASGTTGTTAQNDEISVAIFIGRVASLMDGGRAYTNSYVEAIFADAALNTGRPGIAMATLLLSATGTTSSTYSTTDSGTPMYGVIGTWKKAAIGTTWPGYQSPYGWR